MTSKFLNTPFASWLKIFISAALTQYLVIISTPEMILWSLESLKNLGIAGSVATTPVIINWLNKADPRYGKNKTTEIVEK